MSEKNSNGILKTTAVIAESFRNINITDNNVLELLDNQKHLFSILLMRSEPIGRNMRYTGCSPKTGALLLTTPSEEY